MERSLELFVLWVWKKQGDPTTKAKDGVVGCARTRRSLKYRTWCLESVRGCLFVSTLFQESHSLEDSEEEQSPEKLG